MSIQYSTAIRNGKMDQFETFIGTSAILKLRSGAQPANCAAADSGTVGATLNLPSDWLNAASSGAKTKLGTWEDASADASVTVAHWRLYASDGTTCHAQGSITLTGGGGDLTMDAVALTAGQQITITAWSMTGGNSAGSTALTVAINDSSDPVITRVAYSYTVVVTNIGSNAANSVTATIVLDPQLTYVSSSGTGWSTNHSTGTVTCTRSTLAVGAAPTITINVTAPIAAETSSTTADAVAANAPAAPQDTETTVCNLVDLDIASGWRVPSTSTQWTNFLNFYGLSAISVPNSLWLMQEASGNLADSIGSLTLTAVTSPLYNQAASGFTRLGVAGDDNTNDRFGAAAGVGPDPTTTSQTWMCFGRMGSQVGGSRRLLGINNTTGTNSVRLQLVAGLAGSNRVTTQVGAVGTAGVVDHPVGNKYVFGQLYNRTATAVACFSQLEYIPGTWSAAIVDGAKGYGTVNTPGDFQYVYGWMWSGTAAEISKANMSALLAAMGPTMSW